MNVTALRDPKRPQSEYLNELVGSYARYYHFLYELSKQIGMSYGYWLMLGVNQATCCAHVCEADAAVANNLLAIDNVIAPKAEEIRQHYGFTLVKDLAIAKASQKVLRERYAADMKIGVVFFDTTHTYQQVMGEYKISKPYMNPDNFVYVFDDVHAADDEVMKAIHQISNATGLAYTSLDHLHTNLGFGMIVK